MNFMKNSLDTTLLMGIGLGLLLPAASNYLYNKMASSKMMPTSITGMMANAYVKPAVLVGFAGAVAYAANRYAGLSGSMAGTGFAVATTLIVVMGAKASGILPDMLVQATNWDSLSGLGGGRFGGYSGGYLGYLGDEHPTMGNEMLPQPVDAQLYGMGSSPQVNIF